MIVKPITDFASYFLRVTYLLRESLFLLMLKLIIQIAICHITAALCTQMEK